MILKYSDYVESPPDGYLEYVRDRVAGAPFVAGFTPMSIHPPSVAQSSGSAVPVGTIAAST